jgi:asparagine synthase (glutamine-hydrolysing)
MCGIAGIFSYRDGGAPVHETELLRVRDHMSRRGPDGKGLWLNADKAIGLAHRRLSIIDLSDGASQPMTTADGRFAITFNGEIYNYRTLRDELLAAGAHLRTQSDTEVILHLYAQLGARVVHKLRGMYAFAIWDAHARSLFLARDPFGIKPLYYSDDGSTLRFASQVKALLAGRTINESPEPAGAAGFMLWGYVPEPFTLYRNIVALPAGHYLTVHQNGTRKLEAHFSVREEFIRAQDAARPFGPGDRESLGAMLRDSVAQHLVADVPVGAFLSAGIDSTLITSLAVEHRGVSLHTFTMGFDEYRGTVSDECPIAELTAEKLGTRHVTRWIRRRDFEEDFTAIVDAMDQPTTDGVNTWFVCREAARSGLKVALSGLGGDEMFAGYPSYRDVPRLARWFPDGAFKRRLGRGVRALLAPLLSTFTSPKYAGLLEYGGSFEGAYLLRRALYMPWELEDILDPVAAHVGLARLDSETVLGEITRGVQDERARVAALELAWYMRSQLLRDADWAGMSHSLEVRVPYVDAVLFRQMAPWLVSGFAPSKSDAVATARQPLPREVVERPKTGFAVPVHEWVADATGARRPDLNRGLRAWARRLLPKQSKQFRALVLCTDAYGGHGGIAKFNRDLIGAVAAMPACAEVVAVPRLVSWPPGHMSDRVRFVASAAGGKARFARVAFSEALKGPFDIVVVGHINLSTFGWVLARMKAAQSILVIHGIDAWTQHASSLVRRSLRQIHRVVGVSRLTLERFALWSHVEDDRLRLLPNCVDLERFSPGPKPPDLAAQLGLSDRRIVMTLGRLASEERYKGFDQVLEALPELAKRVPEISYLICGDGPDRARLEQKARDLGVRDRVVFAGFVDEAKKVAYYRLADAYVMPSQGEGFGIVFLEAMGCGIPVMGSVRDGSREALLEGQLGKLVDPSNPQEVADGILATLRMPRGVPARLDHYSVEMFGQRLSAIVEETLHGSTAS